MEAAGSGLPIRGRGSREWLAEGDLRGEPEARGEGLA
jgi:hypothetical protein